MKIDKSDQEQFELMWQFLQFRENDVTVQDVEQLEENCKDLRRLMMQKTAGQRKNKPKDIPFEELGTIINSIAINTMTIYLHGGLKILKETLKDG